MEMVRQMGESLAAYFPKLLGALLILIGFWLAGMILAALVRALLKRTQLDDKLFRMLAIEKKIDPANMVGKVVFYLILLFGLIAFFNALGLPRVSHPLDRLLSNVFEFVPRVVGALVLILVAWAVATLVRMGTSKALLASGLDERLGTAAEPAATDRQSVSSSISNTLYWLVFLLFLPMILGALQLEGLLGPVQTMLDRFLGFLPNLFGAGLILFFGWLAAKIVRQVVTNLLAAVGLDGLGRKTGVEVGGSKGLSGLIGMLVYVLILIPVAISALDTLELGAISAPAGNMLNTIMQSFPVVFTAGLILGIAYMVGRFVSALVSDLLGRTGFDGLPGKLGLGWRPAAGNQTPSQVVGYLVLVTTLFFAAIEAARQLQFEALAQILVQFIEFGGHVLLGLIIFGVGLYLANLASSLIEASNRSESGLLASLSRAAILILTGAMSLREMGLAEEIINMAFGILLAAAGLAIALAFGLGSRDTAGKVVTDWSKYLKSQRGEDT